MTTATVPLGEIVTTPFVGTYGRVPSARFEPVMDESGKPFTGTADRKSKDVTSQWFKVSYSFNGHAEERIVRRSLIGGAEDGRMAARDGKGQAMRFFFEEYVDRDGNIRSCRVEGDPLTQTLKWMDDAGQNTMLLKGFKPATAQEVMDARKRGDTNRVESERLRKANSISAQHTNLADAMAKAIQTNNASLMQAMGGMVKDMVTQLLAVAGKGK